MICNKRHERMMSRAVAAASCCAMFLAVVACAPTGPSGNDNTAANENTSSNENENSSGGPEPVFPENYRETFTEVRNCRFSVEHGGFTIRVLANDIALQDYLNDAAQLPVGSIILKEEYGGPDCDDDTVLQQWRVMLKEAPGFDPNAGDWHWQRVLADGRQVVEDNKASCISCHSVPECFERDYQCTLP